MLSSFLIRNFRSILDLKLDFSYGEGKAPNGWRREEILPFIESRKRLIPCMAFFGANASGKTNLFKAASALHHLVVEPNLLPELFEPNLFNRKFSDTTFELEFFLDRECFDYKVVYNAAEILEEKLQKNQKPLFSINHLHADFSSQIVSATYSREKLSNILKVECSDGEGHQTKTFLNRIGLGYSGLDKDLKSSFDFFKDRFNLFLGHMMVPLPIAVKILATVFNNNETAALQEITEVVRRLDIDIAGIDMIEKELVADDKDPSGIKMINRQTGARSAILITTTHKDSGEKPVVLDFMKHESAGTQRLAGLIGLVLYSLKTGSVLFVDELECSLHPLLMREIVLLFKKRRQNPKGAQLIITTHNTDILDDSILRLSEIALLKKTIANGTLVRRLVDAKKDGEDVRNVTNFRKQYLAGFYSGIPHPAL